MTALALEKYLSSLGTDTPYQPIELGGKSLLHAVQPCIERLWMIRNELGEEVGSLVDVGCHTGWFCRRFALAGWRVIGIDRSADWLDVAIDLNFFLPSDVEHPTYIQMDVTEIGEVPSADVVLCLSTIMYLFDNGIDVGWRTLRRISEAGCRMFMDAGGMYASRVPVPIEELPERILSETVYTSFRLLGRSWLESRPLWMFER